MKITNSLPLLLAGLLFITAAHRAAGDTFGSGENMFDVEFVTIGNPGNVADIANPILNPGDPYPAGAVSYAYRIGKYEVSRDMATKASAAGGLALTLADMGFFGGNGPNRPATGLSWNEAARFVNWLNTSQGFTPAYKFATQPGDVGYSANEDISLWVSGDVGFNAANPFRNSQAHYFLPNIDEGYKAAFYDPSANGGSGAYWDFATGSDTVPTAVASGVAPGTAVYGQTGPADVTQAGGLSPYGVMGLSGNAWEMTETEWELVNDSSSDSRGFRGGYWATSTLSSLSQSSWFADDPTSESNRYGFRIVSVDEPNSPGDFDQDGDVDGGDFLLWQRDHSAGNLADWQANFGMGSLSAAVTVPEPTTMLLAALASQVMWLRRNR